jgi:BASS family bile acid:Na+ symporter
MDPLVDAAIPGLVAVSMAAVGLDLTVDDFRAVGRQPRAVGAALLVQLLALPPLAGAIARLVALPPPAAAALVIIAAAPMGAITNLYVSMAGAGVALSVTLTAAASVVGAAAMPFVAAAALDVLLGAHTGVRVPVGPTVLRLLAVAVVPVGAGMLVRRRRPALARRWGAPLRLASMVAVLFVAAWAAAREWGHVGPLAGPAMLAGALYTTAAGALGWLAGPLASRSRGDRFAIAAGLATRSLGLAAIVGVGVLDASTMLAVVVLVFAVHSALAVTATAAYRFASRSAPGGS